MRAPSELQLLSQLRARGQAPELAVYVTNCRDEHTRAWVDAGHLVIPVVSDHWECDWSAIAGLEVVMYLSFEALPVGTRFALTLRNHNPRRLRFWQPPASAIARSWHDSDGFSVCCPATCAPMEKAA